MELHNRWIFIEIELLHSQPLPPKHKSGPKNYILQIARARLPLRYKQRKNEKWFLISYFSFQFSQKLCKNEKNCPCTRSTFLDLASFHLISGIPVGNLITISTLYNIWSGFTLHGVIHPLFPPQRWLCFWNRSLHAYDQMM